MKGYFKQSKFHDGKCAWVFDKYTKGKCGVCGDRKQWQIRCAFPVCNKTAKMNHNCGGDNDITLSVF